MAAQAKPMYVGSKEDRMAPLEQMDPVTTELDTFEFVYEGPDVNDGTMNAKQLLEVLTGLTRSFSTIAHERDLGDQYELRIKNIEPGSIRLIFEAVEFARRNPAAAVAIAGGGTLVLNTVTTVVSGAYKVITDLAGIISARKRTKGKRIATLPTEFAENEVRLAVADDIVVLTKEQYELLLGQRIDRQISQIVSPLSPRRIENFQIRRSDSELVRVDASERDYFDYREVVEVKSKEGTEIIGTLNSLTKSNLRGTFYTQDGVHVPYRYVGGDIQELLNGFSAREPLRVRGRINYGNDGLPNSIEVQEIEFLQRNFLR